MEAKAELAEQKRLEEEEREKELALPPEERAWRNEIKELFLSTI